MRVDRLRLLMLALVVVFPGSGAMPQPTAHDPAAPPPQIRYLTQREIAERIGPRSVGYAPLCGLVFEEGGVNQSVLVWETQSGAIFARPTSTVVHGTLPPTIVHGIVISATNPTDVAPGGWSTPIDAAILPGTARPAMPALSRVPYAGLSQGALEVRATWSGLVNATLVQADWQLDPADITFLTFWFRFGDRVVQCVPATEGECQPDSAGIQFEAGAVFDGMLVPRMRMVEGETAQLLMCTRNGLGAAVTYLYRLLLPTFLVVDGLSQINGEARAVDWSQGLTLTTNPGGVTRIVVPVRAVRGGAGPTIAQLYSTEAASPILVREDFVRVFVACRNDLCFQVYLPLAAR